MRIQQHNPSVCGFTLLEVLVVLAIIGILIAIAIPSYQIYLRRAHYVEIVQATAPYKTGIEMCFQVTSNLADCKPGKNGVPPTLNKKASFSDLVKDVMITQEAKIIIIPKNKFGITPEDTFTLTPIVKRGALTWVTGGHGVALGYAN